jgi:hypothetical protein
VAGLHPRARAAPSVAGASGSAGASFPGVMNDRPAKKAERRMGASVRRLIPCSGHPYGNGSSDEADRADEGHWLRPG